jgi:2-keto-4-pentenoate hydratase/2-oxohepta-3-ene-1,7-dioic acid hydratase in catechol pathway
MHWTLATYRSADGAARAAVIVGDRLYDAARISGRPGYASVAAVLDDWPNAEPALERAVAAAPGDGLPLAATPLLAPIERPGEIFCAGANFTDHMAEMAQVMNLPVERDPHELGIAPWHFLKSSRGSVVGPGAAVAMPTYSKMLDWEIELAAVIGRPAKNVQLDRALEHVAGYTIANDLSARDFVKRDNVDAGSPFRWDWVSQKCFDGSCPLGPWITPASQIADPQNLAMKLWVGDALMQDSHTSRMIFTLAEQIVHLSSRVTLYPGDLILTGTPAGVGMAKRRFLQRGERVRLWIEGIGELTHRVV